MSLQDIVGSIASSAAGERAGWVIVHSLWQFAAVAVLVAVVLRALASASALLRYRVLTGALLVMAALPVATWLSLSAPTQATLPAAGDAGTPTTPQASSPDSNLTRGSAPAAVAFVRVPAPTEPAQEVVTVRSLARALAARIRPWMGWIVAAWALGVVFFALRPLVGWLAWRRLTRVGVAPVPEFVEAIAARAAMQLRVARPEAVLASSITRVPAVAGWFRPVILMPAALLTTLPVAELEAIIVHELVHVRRGDFLVNVLQMAIEALGFYHPAVWWLSRKIRETRELACDDLVLAAGESPLAYGRALVAVEELRSRAPAFALGASDGSLVARIRRITRLDPEPARASAWPLSALVAAGCVAATLLMMPGGLLAPSRAVAADATADLPDLLTVKELTEEQAWAIVEAQLQKPALCSIAPKDQFAALLAKGATAEDIAAVRAEIAAQSQSQSPDWIQALYPSLYPNGVPASIQRAANEFREYLFLPALSAMTPEVAAALATHQGDLYLPRLAALPPEVARVFDDLTGPWRPNLDVSGLATLPVETVRILGAQAWQSIALPDVPITPELAEALLAIEYCEFSFPTIETLTPEVVAVLAAHPAFCNTFRFASVKSLSAEVAAELANAAADGGVVDLRGLTELTPDVAFNLASSCDLWLSGLRELSPEVASSLVGCSGELRLSGLRELSPEAAAELGGFNGRSLCLSGMTELPLAAAQGLSSCTQSHLDLSGVTDLSPEVAQELAGLGGLDLSGLRELSPDVAGALGTGAASPLRLAGITSLSLEAATALSGYSGGHLDLSGLESLDADVAEALTGTQSSLVLDGLTTLTPELARALAWRPSHLWLRGVTDLTPEVAKLLATTNGFLNLGIERLTPEVAEALALHSDHLGLLRVKTVSLEAARALSAHQGRIMMPMLDDVTPEIRSLLEKQPGDLPGTPHEGAVIRTAEQAREIVADPVRIQKLAELSPEAAAILAAGNEHLTLGNLRSISPEVAAALAQVKGGLVLGVQHLDHEEAAALATSSAHLRFNRLSELSPEAARALATCSGWLGLQALTTISADTAAALVRRSGTLELASLTTLTPEVAAALATADERMELRLSGLQTLSPEVAAALAKCRASLSLGLGSLTPEVAAALAPCPATLTLDNLKRLSPEAAAAIGRRQGGLALAIKTLSPEVARGLAQCEGAVNLDDLRFLSAPAASALAEAKSPFVALRGLTVIAPDVAAALAPCQAQLDLPGLEAARAEVERSK